MKVSIIVGHTLHGKDKGAIAYNGMPESEWNYAVANLMKSTFLTCEFKIFLRDNTTYKKMAREIKEFNPDVHFELHFNSFAKAALGCECLALDGDPTSIAFADHVTDYVRDVFGSKERNGNGVLKIGVGGRGYLNLKIIKDALPSRTPVVLMEPCFANFKTEESEKIIENPQAYASCLCLAVQRWWESDQRKHGVDIAALPKSPATTIEMVKGLIKRGYGV